MVVSGRSDFLAYHNFPEVYHGEEVSEALFSAAAFRIAGQEINTTYRKNSAAIVAHLVSWGRSVPEELRKIRNQGFSDLCEKRKKLILLEQQLSVIVALITLLPERQQSSHSVAVISTPKKKAVPLMRNPLHALRVQIKY